MNKVKIISIVIFLMFFSLNCVKKIALNKVADALTAEGGTVFTGDNDPLLIKDALPFSLKTYESLLSSMPENQKLLLATGRTFCMYSFAFIQSPADTLQDEFIDTQTEQLLRSKKMYLRAWSYLTEALDLRYPGFKKSFKTENYNNFILKTTEDDLDLLYWAGMSWMGAFTTDIFDMSIKVHTHKAVAMLERVLELDEQYNNGSIHDFFISYRGSMPAGSGGDKKKALEHFNRAIELSKGRRAGPYVSLATSIAVSEQDLERFKSLLEKALAIDPDADPENTLVNILSQIKARWLLRNIENYFLIDSEEDETEFNNEEFLDEQY